MSEPTPDQSLHLPSLVIKNFRGIDELTIPRLGRVTLLAGKNGVGKTTVLDAVRVYAARGHYSTLNDVLIKHEEHVAYRAEEGGDRILPDYRALFHGRSVAANGCISIGPLEEERQLHLEVSPANDDTDLQLAGGTSAYWTSSHGAGPRLTAKLLGSKQSGFIARLQSSTTRETVRHLEALGGSYQESSNFPSVINYEIIGPGTLTNLDLSLYWNSVALTSHEDSAVDALNLIYEEKVRRVAVLSIGSPNPQVFNPRALVTLETQTERVPLRSLGDGAVRLFGIALAFAASTNGFLLIDEAENGIHHSIQAKFWNMVLQTAERNNVQVIATTHSWDCVVGFAEAANKLEDVEGLLVRLERPPAGLRPITYDESRLKNIAKHGIEVR